MTFASQYVQMEIECDLSMAQQMSVSAGYGAITHLCMYVFNSQIKKVSKSFLELKAMSSTCHAAGQVIYYTGIQRQPVYPPLNQIPV